MKLLKRFLSAVAVLSLIAAVPMSASAATDVIDFEDGKVPASIQMALNADGTADGDPSVLSVVEFNGSRMLMVEPQKNDIPKVKFMVADLVGKDAFANVRTIEYDLIIEKPDDVSTTWNGGTIGATPTGPSGWANGKEWKIQDDNKNVSDITKLSITLTDDFAFTDSEKAFFMFMNWAKNGTNMYFDNIRLLDKDGNAVQLSGLGGEEKVTETKAEAKAEVKADTKVEATADTTAAPKTGVVSYAGCFAAGAAVMMAGAVIFKKRKSTKA